MDKKKVGLIAGVIIIGLVLTGGGLAFYSHSQNQSGANEASKQQTQQQIASKGNQDHYKIVKDIDPDGHYRYGGQNSGVPNGRQLNEWKNDNKFTLSTLGAIYAPAQDGLKNPLKTLPIHEGVSNRVLSIGWGTVHPNIKLSSKQNHVYAIHNFADGVTYGSPLQYLDVSKRPKAYVTDGKKVYTVPLTKRQVVGRTSKEYTQAVAEHGKNEVTFVTCDEPTSIANLRPNNRVINSGVITKIQKIDEVSSAVQNQFMGYR